MKNKNTVQTSCPNCWGYQEYNGNTYENIIKRSLGWIQDYVKKYLIR